MRHISTLIILLFLACSTAWASKPLDKTKQFVDAIKVVKKNQFETYNNVDRFINYDYIMSKTIEPNREKFSNGQADSFKKQLTQLIRLIAYPRSGKYYNDAKYQYDAPKTEGNKVNIIQNSYLPSEDIELEIAYQWRDFQGNWMITDILFDGDSLVKDYQNQFSRIISKDGVAGLLKKVSDKLKEVEQESQ